MSEINCKELKKHLKDCSKRGFAPVCLIYGEELLYKTAFEELLDALIPVPARSLNYESLDGTDENIYKIIERVNTFPFLPGIKVVAVCNSRIFYSKQDEEGLLEKVRKAYNKDDIRKAAEYFVSLLSLLNLSFDDVGKAGKSKSLKLNKDRLSGDNWLDKITGYCTDNGLSIPDSKENSRILQEAIEKGFPEGNHLIITADTVDKRQRLFKTINEKGVIIDCSVPKGDRAADRTAQEAVLSARKEAILAQSRKSMDRDAYQVMYEMTGFDLCTFSNNLEKLVNYVGDRTSITVEDVEYVLRRTKKDPIYELTNAVLDRNTERALFFLDSLLCNNFHPLQILATMVNQARKLLLVKGFVESPHGSTWHPGIQYGHFQSDIMPAIHDYDKALLKQSADWERMLSKNEDAEDADGKSRKRKKTEKRAPATDLLVVKSSKSPYPVYKMLIKSEGFTRKELIGALERLNRADLQLKTSRQIPKLILEKAIFQICGL